MLTPYIEFWQGITLENGIGYAPPLYHAMFPKKSTFLNNREFKKFYGDEKSTQGIILKTKDFPKPNLEQFIKNLDDKDNTVVGDDASFISGGQKQRIALARILYLNRDIIVLDEFTNNLDKQTASDIFEQLLTKYKGKKTIIFATHDVELAKLSDENHIF